MSAVASFYLLNTSKLSELALHAEIIVKKTLLSKKVTDNYWNYLSNNSTQLKAFDGSGYIYGNLIVFLQDEKGIDLTHNEYDSIAKDLIDKRSSSHFLFTNKQRSEFLNQLNPTNYELIELQKFNKEFSDEGDEETARLTMQALQLLHDNLGEVQNENQILLLIIA